MDIDIDLAAIDDHRFGEQLTHAFQMVGQLVRRNAGHFPKKLLVIIVCQLLFVNNRRKAMSDLFHDRDLVLLAHIPQPRLSPSYICCYKHRVWYHFLNQVSRHVEITGFSIPLWSDQRRFLTRNEDTHASNKGERRYRVIYDM